ncbi:MFS transporter [Lachnoclostridium sp. Marseille-P6806]|uniref:MFS transporter n=1 Tax=Lachnoclostridium sp. Marseille-P6806 TaxID=2364793 RepID=UPI0010317138|nr:MFS transporter [Lachnoclostridium sp. Marseille-P6806]
MGKEKKINQSEIDGVEYRRAKLWQIIFCAFNAFVGMSVYTLIGMSSYTASIGFGITTAVIGVILTCTRILDGITDPFLALLYDKIDTKFGRLRVLIISGFLIEAVALWAMFDGLASKGLGTVAFVLLYIVYVIGYTITNMTAQTIPPLLTNDPKQRPTVGVWFTAFNYLVPMVLSIVFNTVLLPMFGGEYNQAYLATACKVCLAFGAVGIIFVCIGISEYDKPKYYKGIAATEPLKIKDMLEVLKYNKPFQSYIAAQSSDKIAQITASQSIIATMMYGIIIGNMGLATILSVVSMLPSIIFAVFGAKYAGKHGAKNGIVFWTKICMVIAVLMCIFFVVIDPGEIAVIGSITMILYVLLSLAFNGAKMCVTTCATSFMADVIDFELDRSGKFIPAVITGTYSLIDKLISSFGVLMATGAVALVGYIHTVPQPTDALTPEIFAVTLVVYFGLPIIGWMITLVAMKGCKLDKAEMVEVQKRIAGKKEQR